MALKVYSKVLISSIVSLSAMAISAHAFALAAPGLYIGGQAGYGNVDYSSSNVYKTDQDNLAGRAFIGFSFTPYIALEGGYLSLPDNKFTLYPGAPKLVIKTDAWDVLAKLTVPLSDLGMNPSCSPVSLYVKGGAAYVNADVSGYLSGSDSNWQPEAAAGLAYHFSTNLSADISYNHIFSNSDHPKVEFAALGLIYNF